MPYKDPAKARARGRTYARKWRAANPEAVKASNKRNYRNHLADRLARGLRYYYAHREELLAEDKKNPAKRKAIRKASLHRHPETRHAIAARRRARKKHAPRNDLTAAQWEGIKHAFGYRCAYCGKRPKRLEKEHITPLARGGSHTVWNVVPACRACNIRKFLGPPPVPVQPLLLSIA